MTDSGVDMVLVGDTGLAVSREPDEEEGSKERSRARSVLETFRLACVFP